MRINLYSRGLERGRERDGGSGEGTAYGEEG